ncbi:exported hypothetical protein [Azospirillaceae bacterium]
MRMGWAALVLVILLAALCSSGPVRAQTPLAPPQAEPRAADPRSIVPHPLPSEQFERSAREAMLFHFATEYTNSMFIGMAAGSLVGYVMFSTPGGALVGAVLGASAGSWWFYNRLASEFVLTNTTDIRTRPLPR